MQPNVDKINPNKLLGIWGKGLHKPSWQCVAVGPIIQRVVVNASMMPSLGCAHVSTKSQLGKLQPHFG